MVELAVLHGRAQLCFKLRAKVELHAIFSDRTAVARHLKRAFNFFQVNSKQLSLEKNLEKSVFEKQPEGLI